MKSRFYRIGNAEYTFISLLDGVRTFADAFGKSCALLKEDALSEMKAASLCRWLVETGIATTPQTSQTVRLLEATERTQQAKWKSRLNLIFLKTPLGNPDRLMQIAHTCFGWMFSWWFFLVWLAVLATGIACVAIRHDRIWESSQQVISNNNWMLLIAAWLLLKVVHEGAHGVASKKFGVVVREFGVMWILCIPLPYVDVTSAWRIHSRSKRMLISAAGMYIELLIAAVAAIVWYTTHSPIVQQHAFNVMFTGSVVTILFNANPLMRFDGYYMLTDFLEMPNLATHGQQFMRHYGRRLFWGLGKDAPTWPEGRGWFVATYSAAALVWRVLIYVGLSIAACTLFHGIGIALAALALCMWIVFPLIKAIAFTIRGSDTETPNRLQFLLVTTAIVAALVGVASLPYGRLVYAPLVVDYYPVEDVRARVSGFVERVHVKAGQHVQRGDVLLQLRNPELMISHQRLVDELAQCRQRQRHFHSQESIAAWQAERTGEKSILKQIAHSQSELDDLQVTASRDGIILDAKLENLQGKYLHRGDYVAQLGTSSDYKLISLIAEKDVDLFRDRLGQEVDVHIDGHAKRFTKTILVDVQPRATKQLPHHAFAATTGGELDIELTQADSPATPTVAMAEKPQQNAELIAPRFVAALDLPADATTCRAGQTGCVSFRMQAGTVGQYIQQNVLRWYQRQLDMIERNTRS